MSDREAVDKILERCRVYAGILLGTSFTAKFYLPKEGEMTAWMVMIDCAVYMSALAVFIGVGEFMVGGHRWEKAVADICKHLVFYGHCLGLMGLVFYSNHNAAESESFAAAAFRWCFGICFGVVVLLYNAAVAYSSFCTGYLGALWTIVKAIWSSLRYAWNVLYELFIDADFPSKTTKEPAGYMERNAYGRLPY